jgi:hypothetical protein
MEPLHPALRDELKKAHPGLTDADIDQYEELTSLRFGLDPSTSAQAIREIDAQRAHLVRTKMPRLAEVRNAFTAHAREEGRRIKTPPRIEIRTPADHPARY